MNTLRLFINELYVLDINDADDSSDSDCEVRICDSVKASVYTGYFA